MMSAPGGIGFEVRFLKMRGFKAIHKVLAHPYLASFLRADGGLCDPRKVI